MAISFRILRPYPARHVSAGGAPCGDLIGLVRATDSFPVRVCRKPTRDTKEFLLQCLAPISGHEFFKGLFLSLQRGFLQMKVVKLPFAVDPPSKPLCPFGHLPLERGGYEDIFQSSIES